MWGFRFDLFLKLTIEKRDLEKVVAWTSELKNCTTYVVDLTYIGTIKRKKSNFSLDRFRTWILYKIEKFYPTKCFTSNSKFKMNCDY